MTAAREPTGVDRGSVRQVSRDLRKLDCGPAHDRNDSTDRSAKGDTEEVDAECKGQCPAAVPGDGESASAGVTGQPFFRETKICDLGSEAASNMRPPFCPIEAWTAEHPPVLCRCQQVDSQSGEEFMADSSYLAGVFVEND